MADSIKMADSISDNHTAGHLRVLFIDNFDSFTYNLVDEFRKRDCDVRIYRNNISRQSFRKIVEEMKPELIVISPGPSHPRDAGICIDIIKDAAGEIPLFGICLGHQCMIEALGGKVSRAPRIVHGKKSLITQRGTANSVLLRSLPEQFNAGRYHSLYGSKIPKSLKVTSYVEEESVRIPMSIESRELKLFGVQFHPESILTAEGGRIISNVIEFAKTASQTAGQKD